MSREIEDLIINADYSRWARSEEKALAKISTDGNLLQYVKNQTEAICVAAVEQDGYALKYVNNQTEAICIAAVKQNGGALRYVHPSIRDSLIAKRKKEVSISVIDGSLLIRTPETTVVVKPWDLERIFKLEKDLKIGLEVRKLKSDQSISISGWTCEKYYFNCSSKEQMNDLFDVADNFLVRYLERSDKQSKRYLEN